jgi:enamine deaminase RidA (YjgF/YER057c/UK114 family)
MMFELFDPQGVHKPRVKYAHAALVTAGTDILYISGQVGISLEGEIVEGFTRQCRLAYRNLLAVLESKGLTPEHIFKTNLLLTEVNNVDEMFAIQAELMGDFCPASTLMVLKSLARPQLLFEVEALAACPA